MSVTHAQRKLSVYFVIVTLSVTALIAVIVTCLQIYLAYISDKKQLYGRFELVETSYVPSLEQALWNVDEQRINIQLDGLAKLPGIGDITLQDDIGTRWQRLTVNDGNPLASRKFNLFYQIDDDRYPVGELHVSLVADDIYHALFTKAVAISITSFLSLLAAAVVILVLFRYAISQHLEKLAEYTANIDSNKLEQPLNLNRKAGKPADEIDKVVTAINKMRLNILHELNLRADVEQQLIRHRQHLETQVAARTEQLEENNQLLQLQSSELASQNEELDAYAHTVAHDLKHPLTALLSQTTLLKEAANILSEQKRNALLQEIHFSAKKMNDIIDSLLLLASVRRSESMSATGLDVKAIAQNAIKTLERFAQQHNATLNLVGTWPSAQGYAPWLEQVWVNFISNAIKYGGQSPTVTMGAQRVAGHKVKYWIQDNGPGVDPANQHKLFVQFNRLDTKIADGHGLGLSIVQRIISRLGGETGFESPASGGSLFWFTLPASDAP